MKFIKIITVFILFIILGCASKYQSHEKVYYTPEKNVSTGIILKCKRHFGQTLIIGHIFKIDNEDPLEVEPNCEIPIFLTEGHHTLRIISKGTYPKPANPGARSFDLLFGGDKIPPHFLGLKTLNFYLTKNEIKKIIYKTPFLTTMEGSIKIEE